VNEQATALAEIVDIARRNQISTSDIENALNAQTPGGDAAGGVVRRLLAYIGGTFVFAGIAVYIVMFWEDINSAGRIIITLGAGVVTQILAIQLLDHDRLDRAATPLFLMAGWLLPAGIMVAFNELGTGGDPRHAVLVTTTIMLLQQLLLFMRYKRAVLLFIALVFGALTFGNALDLLGMHEKVNTLIIGLSLILLSYGIDQTEHRVITPFWYFLSSAVFLWAAFGLLEDTPFHLSYLGLTAFMVYVSTLTKSRSLLFVSTLAMIGYLGYFTQEYFVDSSGWPVALIFMGLVLIGLSNMALRINRRYMAET
jgi:hypothetical protein